MSENQAVGSLATKEVKKPHSFREVGGVEGRRCRDLDGLVPNPCDGGYKMEGYLRSQECQPHTRLPSPGFQHQKGKSP